MTGTVFGTHLRHPFVYSLGVDAVLCSVKKVVYVFFIFVFYAALSVRNHYQRAGRCVTPMKAFATLWTITHVPPPSRIPVQGQKLLGNFMLSSTKHHIHCVLEIRLLTYIMVIWHRTILYNWRGVDGGGEV